MVLKVRKKVGGSEYAAKLFNGSMLGSQSLPHDVLSELNALFKVCGKEERTTRCVINRPAIGKEGLAGVRHPRPGLVSNRSGAWLI